MMLQVEGVIGPAGDLACETQALLAAESAPVSSDFPDKVPPFHIKPLPGLYMTCVRLWLCNWLPGRSLVLF